jgi:hypothetical protein
VGRPSSTRPSVYHCCVYAACSRALYLPISFVVSERRCWILASAHSVSSGQAYTNVFSLGKALRVSSASAWRACRRRSRHWIFASSQAGDRSVLWTTRQRVACMWWCGSRLRAYTPGTFSTFADREDSPFTRRKIFRCQAFDPCACDRVRSPVSSFPHFEQRLESLLHLRHLTHQSTKQARTRVNEHDSTAQRREMFLRQTACCSSVPQTLGHREVALQARQLPYALLSNLRCSHSRKSRVFFDFGG